MQSRRVQTAARAAQARGDGQGLSDQLEIRAANECRAGPSAGCTERNHRALKTGARPLAGAFPEATPPPACVPPPLPPARWQSPEFRPKRARSRGPLDVSRHQLSAMTPVVWVANVSHGGFSGDGGAGWRIARW